MLTILELCSGTGSWGEPYERAGYDVMSFDLENDVRLIEFASPPPVRGVLAAPPCTHLCVSGARWWEEKGDEALLEALSVVDACMRLVWLLKPKWWALENPVGRLNTYLGDPVYSFQPSDFGDPYHKKTMLWGEFNHPRKNPVEPTNKDYIHKLPPSEDRARLRSITPPGFAQAFFEANP